MNLGFDQTSSRDELSKENFQQVINNQIHFVHLQNKENTAKEAKKGGYVHWFRLHRSLLLTFSRRFVSLGSENDGKGESKRHPKPGGPIGFLSLCFSKLPIL